VTSSSAQGYTVAVGIDHSLKATEHDDGMLEDASKRLKHTGTCPRELAPKPPHGLARAWLATEQANTSKGIGQPQAAGRWSPGR
jgi:hypothetical protein